MQVPTSPTQRPGGLEYKWIVAIVVIFGAFMSVLDQTIVNIAVPRLESAFGAGLNSVQENVRPLGNRELPTVWGPNVST